MNIKLMWRYSKLLMVLESGFGMDRLLNKVNKHRGEFEDKHWQEFIDAGLVKDACEPFKRLK